MTKTSTPKKPQKPDATEATSTEIYESGDYSTGYAKGRRDCEKGEARQNTFPLNSAAHKGYEDGFYDFWSTRQVALAHASVWRG